MVSRLMIIQQRSFFELRYLSLYAIVLLLLPYKKLVSRATLVVVGDGTMKRRPECMENEREALLEFKQGIVYDYGIGGPTRQKRLLQVDRRQM